MRRYSLRHFVLLTVLLGVPAFTCGVTMQGLNMRVAALEAELNKQPVVIDANGTEVGTVIDMSEADDQVMFVLLGLEGLPFFTLTISDGRLIGDWYLPQELLFSSPDCSGTALMRPTPFDLIRRGRDRPMVLAPPSFPQPPVGR